jgi:transcription antitermination factor NusA-like protein
VPYPLLGKAIGENGINIHKMKEILRRKVRIIPNPRGIQDIKTFIENIINPLVFKNIEIKENTIIISANKQNKAGLIGRDKKRLKEMQSIIRDFFEKEFRII